MVNIKIIDTGANRYLIENDTIYLGRRYDDGAEFITVEKPEAEQDSVCLLLVATLEGKIIDQFTVTDEPIAITSNLSQYPSLKIGFSFLRPDDSVKNSEPKQIFFLSAIKPSDFKPAPSQKEPLYELLTKAFAKVVYIGKNLSFYNIFDDKVATVEIESGGAKKQSDLAETDSTSETFIKGKKTSNLTNDGDGQSPFATQKYADNKVAAVKTEAQTAQDAANNAQTAIDDHKADNSNPHGVTKAQIGLGKADNTSDAEKPISNATAAALEGKFDKTGGSITGDVDISGILEVSGNINAKAGISAVNDITVAGAPVATKNNAGLTVGNLVKWGTGYVLDDSGKSIDDLLSKTEANESYVSHSTDQEGKFVLYSRTGTNVDGVTVLGTTEALSEPTNIPVYVGSSYGASLVNGYLMTNIPSQDYQAANKKYVDDGFVAKHTGTHTGYLVYSVDSSNTPYMFEVGMTPKNIGPGKVAAFNFVGRGTTEPAGTIFVAMPTADYDAAPKKYVDDNTGIYIDTSLLAEA